MRSPRQFHHFRLFRATINLTLHRNGRSRYSSWQLSMSLSISIACLSVCERLFALDPSLSITQYAHSVWTPQNDGLPGTVQAITQTADGNLWIGTEFGLLRFDGIR